MMKVKLLATLALMMASLSIAAQDTLETRMAPDRSLSLELFGAHSTVGINYDSRLSGSHGWGYRVGIGYGYSEISYFSFASYNVHGIAAPL